MKFVPYTCRICKREHGVQVDEDCPQAWIDTLIPLLTCNRCHDHKVQTSDLTEKIGRAVSLFVQSKGRSDAKEVHAKIHDALCNLTRQYSQVLASFYLSTAMIWDVEFVNIILEKPEQWFNALRNYSAFVKKELRNQT